MVLMYCAQEARKHIDAVRAEASNASQAAASLQRLQGQGSQQQADSARSGWLPNKGDRVQVPSMGGATGEVNCTLHLHAITARPTAAMIEPAGTCKLDRGWCDVCRLGILCSSYLLAQQA